MMKKSLENLANDLALSIGLIIRKMRSTSPSESDFTWTQKAIFVRLDKDGPMTISDLARAEGMKSQSMGTAVVTLEEAGLVERLPHPTDGRQVLIRLTKQGAAMRKLGRDARRTWLAEAISKLDDDDQETLVKAAHILSKLVE